MKMERFPLLMRLGCLVDFSELENEASHLDGLPRDVKTELRARGIRAIKNRLKDHRSSDVFGKVNALTQCHAALVRLGVGNHVSLLTRTVYKQWQEEGVVNYLEPYLLSRLSHHGRLQLLDYPRMLVRQENNSRLN